MEGPLSNTDNTLGTIVMIDSALKVTPSSSGNDDATTTTTIETTGEPSSPLLHKSTSTGNLSRFTAATTSDGTESLSIGKTDVSSSYDRHRRLTVFQIVDESCGDDILSTVVTIAAADVDDSSSLNSTVEGSAAAVLPDGIPSEVLVIPDYNNETSCIRGSLLLLGEDDDDDLLGPRNERNVKDDHHHQLELYRTLLESYRDKLRSTNQENDVLHEFLRQTQGYADDLLSQRQELIETMEEMEEDVSQRNDQELLLKVIMLFSMLMYLSGGAPEFLVAAVGLQLFATLVNLFT